MFSAIYVAKDAPVVSPNKDLHGGKGAGLISMAQLGYNVPEAMVFTTEAWKEFRETGELPASVENGVADMLQKHPDCMFSVRSGAPVSMPGMMDTILNVGVGSNEDELFPGCLRRFVSGWLEIVKGLPKQRVDYLMKLVDDRSKTPDGDWHKEQERWRALVTGVLHVAGENVNVPMKRREQILECVRAVFNSWDTPRAKAYREMHGIPEDMGTACIVQRMVMGTAAGFSGTGVLFSRDPSTGENKMTGEFLFHGQGEEVVAGTATGSDLDDLKTMHPELYGKLSELATSLEDTFADVQDVEFTVENGELYVLQTRVAKMSARARIVTACDIAYSLFPDDVALQRVYIKSRVNRAMVEATRTPTVAVEDEPDFSGLPASPGALCGKVVFRSTPLSEITKDCILVCHDTSPDDFPQMSRAGAILTAVGGFTCHSAVVARGIGVPAVVGSPGLTVDNANKLAMVELPDGELATLTQGDEITLDGSTGGVYLGGYEVVTQQPPRVLYERLFEIAQNSADIPDEAYYIDCGLGQRAVLVIDPFDAFHVERQLQKFDALMTKGKDCAFFFEVEGVDEGMFTTSVKQALGFFAEDYKADFDGTRLLGASPSTAAPEIAECLGMTYDPNSPAVVVDLLDLLD